VILSSSSFPSGTVVVVLLHLLPHPHREWENHYHSMSTVLLLLLLLLLWGVLPREWQEQRQGHFRRLLLWGWIPPLVLGQ
jgi:hypothetical protein